MNKNFLKLILIGLIVLLGNSIFVLSVEAENGLVLEVIKDKECNIQCAGDWCVAELKLTNNTREVLEGEAFLHIDYQGLCSNNILRDFDGEGIKAQFFSNDNWLNFSGWENGITTVSGFDIAKGETQPKLKIETVLNLCPGEYAFTLELKGTTEKEEYITPPVVIGGGGGGAIILSISEESVHSTLNEFTVTINWSTNDFSTSQVIYSAEGESHTLDLNDNIGVPPKYGYAHTTIESDTAPKVTYHTVVLTGLNPNITYYYRTVSHGSFYISNEYSFTTPSTFVQMIAQIPGGGITPPSPSPAPSGEEGLAAGGTIEETTEKPLTEETGIPKEVTFKEITLPEERIPQRGLPSMLAAIGMTWGEIISSPLLTIITILSLMGLVTIGVREWWLFKKMRKK